MADFPELVSTRTAARMLGVTVKTVQRFAMSGTLPAAFRLDNQRGAFIFQKSDVADLAERRKAA